MCSKFKVDKYAQVLDKLWLILLVQVVPSVEVDSGVGQVARVGGLEAVCTSGGDQCVTGLVNDD